jgi:arabinofuranosyltransferase
VPEGDGEDAAAAEAPARRVVRWPPSAKDRQRLLLIIPVVIYAILAWQRRWMQEDGFINLRIANQVLAGHGPVFNAGQRVEAYTSPLWLAILVVLKGLLGWALPFEWLAVLAGIALSVAGVAFVVYGARELQVARRRGRFAQPEIVVPAGIAVILAIPAFWDFASSGLETGLAMGWIGACFFVLSRHARLGNRRKEPSALGLPSVALLGLGPLVRPELLLYSVSFAVVAVLLSPRDLRSLLPRIATFLAAPVAYQLFRMGFFATVLPNTALAKDASAALWDRGLRYVGNFTGPYAVWVPLVALVALVALCRPWRANRAWITVALGMALPATLQLVYVVRVGGDYMHGRFLIVPVLALIAPVAVVPLDLAHRGWRRQAPVLAVLGIWMVVCAFSLRPRTFDTPAMEDQRAAVVGITHEQHPVRVSQQPEFLQSTGHELALGAHGDVLVVRNQLLVPGTTTVPRRKGLGPAASSQAIGVPGYILDTDVPLIDPAGLAEPIAARQPTVNEVRAGSAHALTPDWLAARAQVRTDELPPGAKQAEHALRCGALGRLVSDTEHPLTVGRFFGNWFDAVGNTTLEIPASPAAAERQFCGSG